MNEAVRLIAVLCVVAVGAGVSGQKAQRILVTPHENAKRVDVTDPAAITSVPIHDISGRRHKKSRCCIRC